MDSLFQPIKPEDLAVIRDIAEIEPYAPEETIYKQDDTAWEMYIIRTGKVTLYRVTDVGAKVALGVFGPGAFLGEDAILIDAPRDSFAQALEETELYKIHRAKLDALARADLPLATRFYLALIREINKRLKKVNETYSKVKGRLRD